MKIYHLDLEFTSLDPNRAGILSIGCVKINWKDPTSVLCLQPEQEFYRIITLDSLKERGFFQDTENLHFWKEWPSAAEELFGTKTKKGAMHTALYELALFIGVESSHTIFISDELDKTVLLSNMARAGHVHHFNYRLMWDDIEIFKALGAFNSEFTKQIETKASSLFPKKHHALQDAKRQAFIHASHIQAAHVIMRKGLNTLKSE